MRAFFFRELTLLKKFILLLFGISAFIQFYGGFIGIFGEEFPLLGHMFLFGLYLTSMASASLLAYLQTIGDSRRTSEALILHLPIARSVILAGRFLAGIFALSASLFIPFAGMVAFTRTYGNAPFRWEMVYPGITQLIAGFALYPAALWYFIAQGRDRIAAFAGGGIIVIGGFAYASAGLPGIGDLLIGLGLLAAFFAACRAIENRQS